MSGDELANKYLEIRDDEKELHQKLVWIDTNYPKSVTEQSVEEILKAIKEKLR